MEIRVLGAHNRESVRTGCFSLLVDGRLAVDAGALGSRLTLEEQEAIEAMLLTHQHLDHIKDVPTVGFNTLFRRSIDVYTSVVVRDALNATLLNPQIWLPLFDFPEGAPCLVFHEARPYEPLSILGSYRIVPVPSHHKPAALGFYVERDGASFLYTCDTGPGFVQLMGDLEPQLVITEVTLPNAQAELAESARHLTPDRLRGEIDALQARGRPVPRLLVVHVDPRAEQTIHRELAEVAHRTGITIDCATEDQRITL